ncbi:sugar O-acetyltransferase [Rhizobium sp. HT1-10]|uniref:sugar O-acetyltransferase n=1 Tax=Rhizobium sp. HT1-10 TaxID=3111638 RepID=UPI003C255ECB
MNEIEKAAAGLLYDANSDPEAIAQRDTAKNALFEFNHTPPSQIEKRRNILRSLIGRTGKSFIIEAPFHCDYGYNISLGENFYANVNLVILDCAKVTIGDSVFVAPNVHVCCAGHPLDVERRNKGLEYAYPVVIEDDVWIGAGAQILPGVTVGKGSVIAAGAIVIRDVPPMTLVAGNPARIIRKITDADVLKYRE